MPPLSSLTMALIGLFGTLNGTATLLSNSALQKNLSTLQLDSTSIPVIHAIALGSVSIGAFYINAAYRRDRAVMWLSVLGRGIAVLVFLGDGGPWRSIAVFEAVCGLLIAGSLVWEGMAGRGEGR
ncbi:hypothetical protein VTL71DRAFT_871 [Oculimacula yallundae]|uniref:DUF4345 domain-containing protein n=1 Tax=Oculimacula yallundae TaxID=86028 RepID=A0ABR4D1A0_9HELO